MSARDVLNADQTGPMQLPMFMRASDLADSLTGTLDRSYLAPDEVMEQKLSQSTRSLGMGHGSGVHESVAREGVLNPVQLVHGMNQSLLLGQGHHRTAAAENIERRGGGDKWVPLIHTDAREHTDAPVDIYSDVSEKRGAIADYRRWSEHTTAIGQDLGWVQSREAAAEARERPRMSEFYGTYSPESGS
jgi:hypothetical protein